MSRKKTIIDKLGLSSEIADWAVNIHPKLSIWIADKVKKDASLYPRAESDFRLIADWFRSGEAGDIKKLSFEEALEKAHQAHEKFIPIDKSLKNFDVILDLGDYKWVKLTKPWHCTEEGEAMGHCIGAEECGHPQGIVSGKLLAYSLRDKFNKPHITLEIDKDSGEVIEFRGKQNKAPEAKYMPYAIEFLKKNKEWKNIKDKTFWKGLFKNKKLGLYFYKEFPHVFGITEKLIVGVPLTKEELNVKGSLYLRNIPIEKLPDNLTVGGDLDLENTPIKELPSNLIVNGTLNLGYSHIKSLSNNLTVGGYLNLSNTPIKELPDNLRVSGGLYLNNTSIKELPDNLTVSGDLDLSNTSIDSLPDNLRVSGNLNLNNSKIEEMPDNLTVSGGLYLNNTLIKELPNKLTIGGNLDLKNTLIKELSDNLTINGYLDLRNTSIKELPDKLTVGESLYLKNTLIKKLPDNLTVGIDLDLSNTPIKELPKNLMIGGSLYLSNTLIKKLPDNLTINRCLYLENTPLLEYYTKKEIRKMTEHIGGNCKIHFVHKHD